MYDGEFDQDWLRHFQSLDGEIKDRVAKKIKRILGHPQKRHLKGASFFVDEIGQYRIVYRVFEENRKVRFYFVGKHKEYEEWYKQTF
jgi:mRNA-degrading endonuclease RelE of RelBE toxin-antitoxin system